MLVALTDGLTADEIAREHFVAVATVRSQIRAVLQKLGVRSQLAAVAIADAHRDLLPQETSGRTTTSGPQGRDRPTRDGPQGSLIATERDGLDLRQRTVPLTQADINTTASVPAISGGPNEYCMCRCRLWMQVAATITAARRWPTIAP